MSTNKIKILVAAHKPNNVFRDEIYTPIHVGRSLSYYASEMQDMIGDDTGENISNKNPSYCELTAIYWAWKNIKDVQYIGLAHYRRYFEIKFSEANIDDLMEGYDVILPRPYRHDRYLEFKLARELTMEDEVILLQTIKEMYPNYEQTTISYLYDFIDIPYNMFIMRKELLDKYARFLFSILFQCEKKMKPLPYTCSSRRFGYIAEFLLPIFCIHNSLKVRYEHIVPFIGMKANHPTEIKQKIKISILRQIYKKHKPLSFESIYDNAVLTGLSNDKL